MSNQSCQMGNPVVRIDGVTITDRDLLVASIAATGVLMIYVLLRLLTR